MLQNAYLLAKIGADTAENEQHFAEILPKTDAAVAVRPRAGRRGPAALPRVAGRVLAAVRREEDAPRRRSGRLPDDLAGSWPGLPADP